MVVVNQKRTQIIPFDKFVFSRNAKMIIATPDIIANPNEFMERIVGIYKNSEEAKEVFEDMIRTYDLNCDVFEMPESEVET